MDTISVLTLRLAEAIGLYLLAIGIGGFVAPDRWRTMVDELERHPGLTMLMGVVAFAIGAVIFGVHHSLHDPLAAIVTIVGAVAAIEGLVLLAAPGLLVAVSRPFLAAARLWAIVSIALGGILFLLGLTGRADPIP